MEFKNPPFFFEKIGVKINKHKGFTLSKVLITLVIIGVIAAITVPNIIVKVYEFAKQYILPYFNYYKYKVEGSKLHV